MDVNFNFCGCVIWCKLLNFYIFFLSVKMWVFGLPLEVFGRVKKVMK